MQVVHFTPDRITPKTEPQVAATTFEQKLRTEHTFAWIIKVGIILALGLGFWYIMLVNSIATRGFALEEEKNRRTAILKEVQKWEIALTIPASLYALESNEQIQEMTAIENQDFIKLKNGQMAMR